MIIRNKVNEKPSGLHHIYMMNKSKRPLDGSMLYVTDDNDDVVMDDETAGGVREEVG